MEHSPRNALPGQPQPLGATLHPGGVNFSLYSEHAERVELCFFDRPDGIEIARFDLPMRTGQVWHGLIPGIRAGQLYGYRVHGPYDPGKGLRFNANKLLIDPYALALAGKLDWRAGINGYGPDDQPDTQDNAWGVPKALVIDNAFDWQEDRAPRTALHDTVIYETHVKGFTMRHPDIPPSLRGTYRGLASAPAIDHLKRLGVTALELLPVHAHVDAKFLVDKGLLNYWGYDTIAYFAPEGRHAASRIAGAPVTEFKEMVRELHRAGIEVILDVVYNHTAEGNEQGPTLSLRGIDNDTYYRLDPDDLRHYVNYTGTGNTLNARHPQVLRLIMDSLRYWVQVMHVDGFRFDLAATLARGMSEVDRFSSFLDAVHQDPVVSSVKLIAEPWDLGYDGYQAGNFPDPWTEWNDHYRDDVRRYWRGDQSETPELAYRLTGSSDIYGGSDRQPQASINFVTAHDGFTLNDLVSYTQKRNQANLEDNRDGRDDNLSANYGVEGPSNDAAITAARERQKRNLLATLLFSQGVPMLLGGDEMGRTQQGNNNAYPQDNEISWFNWDLSDKDRALLDFTRRLIETRRAHPGLRRRGFLRGRAIRGSEIKDITWLRSDGREMDDADWSATWLKCFGLRLSGELGEIDEAGQPVVDDVLLLILNSSEIDLDFTLPPGSAWHLIVDTARPEIQDGTEHFRGASKFPIRQRALTLLRCDRTGNAGPDSGISC